jgi:phage protein D
MTVNTAFYVPDFEIIVNGTTFSHGTTVDIISVSITETINQADSFSISVREHNPQPERFASNELIWLDNKMFDEGNTVQIEMGYRGNRAVTLQGKIKGMNVTFPESGAPTLAVRGLSDYDKLFHKTRRKPFDQRTDSEIAAELAQASDLGVDVQATQVKHALVSPEGATFAAILLERARRLNYEVAVKDGKLLFRRPTYLVDPSPQLTLTWGQDLRSFTPTVATGKMVTQVEVRNTRTGEGGGKQALAGVASASQIQPVLGAVSGLQRSAKEFGTNTMLMPDQRLSSPAEAATLPRAELERRALEYVTGRGACIGNPQLRSRTVIKLQGLGKRFSGSYYVTSTTHTIDANGYRTEFEAKRDALYESV